MNEEFAKDLREGLTAKPKRISSKYFYDERGSALFSQIMELPEYYLTDAEFEIFRQRTDEIIQMLCIHPKTFFELIELGAGDGKKTIELLKVLEEKGFNFRYIPIDISQKALDQLEATVSEQLPGFKAAGKRGDYFQILREMKVSPVPKVVLFLGSNLGNMTDQRAHDFLVQLGNCLSPGDRLLLGADLKKDSSVVLPAYNDSQGVTREFNLNLLDRINREFGADFNVSDFRHAPEYDEREGIAKSAIQSKKEQEVEIRKLGLSIRFAKDEKILTEISRKYDDSVIQQVTENTGFKMVDKLMDSRRFFADYFLEKDGV